MKKNPLKSKTINSALVIALVAIMSMLGFGEQEIAETYDSISQEKKSDLPIKEIITLIGTGGVIFGRFRVKEKDDD